MRIGVLRRGLVSALIAGALVTGVSLVFLGAVSSASPQRHGPRNDGRRGFTNGHPAGWVSSWSASPQAATPGSQAETGFDHQTVRNIVFTSAGGSFVRVRFTNTFGGQPLAIGGATVAVAGDGAN